MGQSPKESTEAKDNRVFRQNAGLWLYSMTGIRATCFCAFISSWEQTNSEIHSDYSDQYFILYQEENQR
jgi:hypothetical protein